MVTCRKGDWNNFNWRLSTSTLGLFDKSYFFATSSANYFSAQGLGFSTTSAAYFLSQNLGNSFSTTSASYFSAQGLAFSTTSANYFANSFRDWSIQNGALTPKTTTLGIGVYASSTIGNGNQNGGLTISGGRNDDGQSRSYCHNRNYYNRRGPGASALAARNS